MFDFLKSDSSRNVEFLSSLQGLGASGLSYLFGVYGGSINSLFLLNCVFMSLQLMALVIGDLEVRHWTNVVGSLSVLLLLLYLFSFFPDSALDVGGYGFLFFMNAYCVYATDRDLKIFNKQVNPNGR